MNGGRATEPSSEAAGALAEVLRARLKTRRIGRALEVFPAVDSTNDLARAAIESASDAAALDGRTFLSLYQRSGRGRQGHAWSAPPGTSFLGSVIFSSGPWPVPGVTAVAALAVVDAIAPLVPRGTTIKWPNDVLVDGKKIAGVLIEAKGGPGGMPTFVVGVGINANQSLLDFPRELRSSATSLRLVRGLPVDLAELSALFLETLERRYASLRAREVQALAESFLDRLGLRGRPVKVFTGEPFVVGSLVGLSFEEGIRLSRPEGPATLPCETVTAISPTLLESRAPRSGRG